MAADHNLTTPSLALYGLLALPLAFAGLPLYIHAPDFYATEHGLSLLVIGGILLGIRLVDAIQDPLIGWYSDLVPHKRSGVIKGGGLLLGLAFLLVFASPSNAPDMAWWFGISMLLATTAFSLVTINYQAMGGLWTDASSSQTRIAAWREGFNLLGLLLAVILPATLMNAGYAKSDAFMLLTLSLIVLLGVGLFGFCKWVKDQPVAQSRPMGGVTKLRILKTHQRFYLIYFLSAFASAIPAVLVLFFIRDFLQAEALTGLFLALYFISGVAGMPLWLKLGKKYGRAMVWAMAMGLATVAFIWAFVLAPGQIWHYAVICVLTGAAFGAELCLPASLLAGNMHTHKQQDIAPTLYAVLIFLGKFALALCSGLVLLALGYVGFVPGEENTPDALMSLQLVYALIPCGVKLCALGLLLYVLFTKNNEAKNENIDSLTHHPRRYDHV